MRKAIYAVASVTVLMSAVPALADECSEELASLNEWLSEKRAENAMLMTGGFERDIRLLRDSARRFGDLGNQEACEDLVADIREVVESREARHEKAAERAEDVDEDRERVDRLKLAKPVTDQGSPWRSEEIMGSDVRSLEDEQIGDIDEIVVDPKSAKVVYAIISHGGFLGLGEEQLAVPWEKLRVTTNREYFVLPVSKKIIENAPTVSRGEWEYLVQDEWHERNRAFYEKNRD